MGLGSEDDTVMSSTYHMKWSKIFEKIFTFNKLIG